MGQLIGLQERLEERASLSITGYCTAFYFDLACPFSYLAAERVERLLGQIDWIPVDGAALRTAPSRRPPASIRAEAEELAAAHRLPLVWPERFPAPVPRVMRAAAHASEGGAGARFALAAARLAFSGGDDLDQSEVLAEVASAAGIPRAQCLAAAEDASRDRGLEATARALRRRGVDRLPAIRIGERWFEGDTGLIGAAAMHRETAPARWAARLPLAPLA